MDSFIITVGEFLHMNGSKAHFESARKNYVIPKYQREYKWSDERVITLINDIKKSSKFLGNIILNMVDDYYELVDGQQRITTIILILMALFNRNKSISKSEQTEEQKKIFGFLVRDRNFILKNESIGDYVIIKDTQICINIENGKDIYFQKDRFDTLFMLIHEHISIINDESIQDFQNKLLDCPILVLIGEPEGREQDSIEEIFLDINFKSQLLDVANIFKGYCFKNYDIISHEELKDQWTNVRKYTKQFEKKFGYEENRETCEYLYLYLLSVPESYKIPANLSPGGSHYLEEKNHTQTKELLEDMVSYGKHITGFFDNLANSNYIFGDICFNANSHENDTERIKSLRAMSLTIMQSKEAQYYKLPFFMLLHFLLKDDKVSDTLDFSMLKVLITNMYIYAFLFTNSGKAKNKTMIAYNILNKIHISSTEIIKDVLTELKVIRRDFLSEFALFRSYNKAKCYAVYSIIDNYTANDNFIEKVYSLHNGYTPEHFLIHDHKFAEVKWQNEANSFSFSLRDLLGKPDGKNYKVTSYKKQTINYLILPKELNEIIEHDDVVSKIKVIKKHYKNSKKDLPNHIDLFFDHIEGMPIYIELVELKSQQKNQDEIVEKYKDFINTYFSDENQGALYYKLGNQFKSTFQNN